MREQALKPSLMVVVFFVAVLLLLCGCQERGRPVTQARAALTSYDGLGQPCAVDAPCPAPFSCALRGVGPYYREDGGFANHPECAWPRPDDGCPAGWRELWSYAGVVGTDVELDADGGAVGVTFLGAFCEAECWTVADCPPTQCCVGAAWPDVDTAGACSTTFNPGSQYLAPRECR